jgi:putative sigma-54 modulation protein
VRAMKRGHRSAGEVDVEVKGKNLPITAALRDQVVSKMQRLDRYLDQLNVIHVELCTEPTKSASDHNSVEATATVRGRTIRVRTSNADMYAAIDESVDKLYRQLNRTKERMKTHSGASLADSLPPDVQEPADAADGSDEFGDEPTIIVERITTEPMFEDEAVGELESSDRTFLVFLNARSEQVNVLYRHANGTYGLIEPRGR